MSRKPGLGAKWYEKYKTDVLQSDSVIINGIEQKPPAFYDSIHELHDKMSMFDIKEERRSNVNRKETTPERLATRELVKLAQLKFLKQTI